jgi:hypothetical protein
MRICMSFFILLSMRSCWEFGPTIPAILYLLIQGVGIHSFEKILNDLWLLWGEIRLITNHCNNMRRKQYYASNDAFKVCLFEIQSSASPCRSLYICHIKGNICLNIWLFRSPESRLDPFRCEFVTIFKQGQLYSFTVWEKISEFIVQLVQDMYICSTSPRLSTIARFSHNRKYNYYCIFIDVPPCIMRRNLPRKLLVRVRANKHTLKASLLA